MADALASGASVRKDVGVQVPPRPPIIGRKIRQVAFHENLNENGFNKTEPAIG